MSFKGSEGGESPPHNRAKMRARRSHRCSLQVKSTPTACRLLFRARPRKHMPKVHTQACQARCLKVPACFTASEYKPESFYGYSEPTVLQRRIIAVKFHILEKKTASVPTNYVLVHWSCTQLGRTELLIHTLIRFHVSTCAVGKNGSLLAKSEQML